MWQVITLSEASASLSLFLDENPDAHNQGFTLIELVIVILLLGILAAFAVPKLLGKGGFETQTLRDELLTRLRLVQTINMHEPADRCTQLVVEASRFAHITLAATSSGCPAPGPMTDWSDNQRTRGRLVTPSAGMAVSLNNASSFMLRFDQMGGRWAAVPRVVPCW